MPVQIAAKSYTLLQLYTTLNNKTKYTKYQKNLDNTTVDNTLLSVNFD